MRRSAWPFLVLGMILWTSGSYASVRVTEILIENRTDKPLLGSDVTTSHGKITTKPPTTILPGQTGRLVSESDGVATGNEGSVRYTLEGVPGTASFHWDNPFVGSNSFDSSAPSGFVTDHTVGHANHTVVFFFVRPTAAPATTCNGPWVVAHLGVNPESSLDTFDEAVAAGSTPLKKIGVQGWVDTGCVASAVGVPVRDAQYSTDGFWTIDLQLRSFSAGNARLDPAQRRFVRIEVEPDTPAHTHAAAKAGVPVSVHGRVFIDTHHGEQLIEIHPYDQISLASTAMDRCLTGFVWRETSPIDHVCVPPVSRQRAADDNRAAPGRRVANGDVCAMGFVWREAVPTDHVCVVPPTRTQTADENRLSGSRREQ